MQSKERPYDQNCMALWVPNNTCRFVQYSVISARITSLYGFQHSSVVLCIQKSDFRTRIACLYGSQTSPVILCMQNSVPSIRITSLYGSQPSSVVLCVQKRDFRTRIALLYGSQPSSVDYACKTATFGPEYKSLWVPALTCRFVHAKLRD